LYKSVDILFTIQIILKAGFDQTRLNSVPHNMLMH